MAEKSTIPPPKSVLIQAGREPEGDIDTQPIQDSDKKQNTLMQFRTTSESGH